MLGIPATGKLITQEGVAIYPLVNARIAVLWNCYDNLNMMQQLGVVPAPGAA